MESCTMEKCVILLYLLALVCSWTPLGLSADVHQTPDFCKLMPKEEPSCAGYFPQIFYNSTSQQCEEFIYGGCGGNQNRFGSKKKCLETCHPHHIHEMKSELMAEACVLSGARHNSEGACSLPPDAGHCLGYFPRYFFNATSASCEIFIYGGCEGNSNRFSSLQICQMYCRVPVLNSTEVCNLPPETGPCRASKPKLYYNPHSQRCEPFIYGGCHGNANRFDSTEECQDVCHPEGSHVMTPLVTPEEEKLRTSDVCFLPSETGPCKANIPRFFFNSTSFTCERFTYGGCVGNGNRFVSERECQLRCPYKSRQTVSYQQMQANVTQKWEEFIYGGFPGN